MGVAASRPPAARPAIPPMRDAPPRRLSRQGRRDQLVAAALPLLARHGPTDLSLDEVAERVGVRRNLLYHYFPGGRGDLVAAVVEEAERQLLGPWAPGAPGTPAPGPQEGLSRLLDHALAPTHAWRIHRLARAASWPSVSSVIQRSTEMVVTTLAAAGSLGDQPSPVTIVALHGYVAFAEAVLDSARAAGLARSDIRRLLGQGLRAVLAAD
jgi:AcrR family transcriptional regulator